MGETLEDLKFTEGMEIRCSHLELSLKKKKEKRKKKHLGKSICGLTPPKFWGSFRMCFGTMGHKGSH